MAIKKAVKSTENNQTGTGIHMTQERDVDHIPDLFDELDTNITSEAPKAMSFQAAALMEANNHPCYGNLVNPPTEVSHWHARQVQAELKVVLRGFSSRNKWWTEERADALIQQPCGLQENGYVLTWQVDPENFDSYLMLDDIRNHMKYAFGDSFIVKPVSELSEDAKGWKFTLGA